MCACNAAKQFHEAVRIYLQLAYRDGQIPERVQRRLNFAEVDDLPQILAAEAFETSSPDRGPEGNRRYRLRLGNPCYPHMKLSVQWMDDDQRAIFSVDCHDTHFALSLSPAESAALKEIRDYNAELKRRIEAAWDEAGVPTFCEEIRSSSTRELPAIGRSKLVLLVEDEDDIREAESRLLESGGYRVAAFAEGPTVLEALDRGAQPDVCLLDIMLPGLDGLELLREIRSRLGDEIPALYVSALPRQMVKAQGALYLEKPFGGEEFLETVARALGGAGKSG